MRRARSPQGVVSLVIGTKHTKKKRLCAWAEQVMNQFRPRKLLTENLTTEIPRDISNTLFRHKISDELAREMSEILPGWEEMLPERSTIQLSLLLWLAIVPKEEWGKTIMDLRLVEMAMASGIEVVSIDSLEGQLNCSREITGELANEMLRITMVGYRNGDLLKRELASDEAVIEDAPEKMMTPMTEAEKTYVLLQTRERDLLMAEAAYPHMLNDSCLAAMGLLHVDGFCRHLEARGFVFERI